MRSVDAMGAVAELAASRHGAFTRAQAAHAHVTWGMLRTRLRRGELIEPVPGVLQVVGVGKTFKARLSVATLAGGGSVASHRAAALLHGFDGVVAAPLEVTVQRGRYPAVEGVVVHRAKALDEADVVLVDGIPTTSVARTLCDLGAVVPQDAVERALDSALRAGAAERWIRSVLERVDRPGPSGTATLARILADPRREGRLPDSWLERLVARALRASDLPALELQHRVLDPASGRLIAVLDGCFVDWRIGIEGHSRAFHGSGRRTWTDLVRDNAVKAAGYELVYVTWDLAQRPEEMIDVVRRIHERRGSWQR